MVSWIVKLILAANSAMSAKESFKSEFLFVSD
jgi:hypothetical protein